MSAKTIRLPYKLFEIFFKEGDSSKEWIWIIRDDGRVNRLEPYFPLGIHPEIARFLIEKGCCAMCGSPINPDFSSCTCIYPDSSYFNLPVHSPDFHLIVECPDTRSLMNKERLRVHAWRRQERIKVHGGKHTSSEIEKLYDIQEGRCFYCGIPLIDEHGKRKLHKDHYVPLESGGNDFIDNIVLACPTCNVQKREEHGDHIRRRAHPSLSPGERKRMTIIRTKVMKFHESIRQDRDGHL